MAQWRARRPPVREDQIDQAERKAVLENDRRVREQQQASTFHQHAQAQALDTAGGRFAQVNAATVIGAQPLPKYPQAGTPFQSDPVGIEPPLGFSVNDLEPSANQLPPPVAVEEPGPASDGDAPSDLADELRAEDAGPLSHKDVKVQPNKETSNKT
jgi:hypothetical protein